MRVVEPHQTQLDDLAFADIQFDIKLRDDIHQLLKGLQYIYVNNELRNALFTLLENHIQPKKSNDNGRPGMDLWNTLAMGVLRLDLNWDYDRLHEQVNNHKTIRQMLGYGNFFDTQSYCQIWCSGRCSGGDLAFSFYLNSVIKLHSRNNLGQVIKVA